MGIDDGAFKNVSSIKGIELPSTIKNIGGYAFYGSSIREIVIPSSVGFNVGDNAFKGCRLLVAADINSNHISKGMFQDCESLTKTTISDTTNELKIKSCVYTS